MCAREKRIEGFATYLKKIADIFTFLFSLRDELEYYKKSLGNFFSLLEALLTRHTISSPL